MSDEQVGEFANLHAVWPRHLKGRRNYKTTLLQALTLLEQRELRRLVRKRVVPAGTGTQALVRKRWARTLIRRMSRLPGSNRRAPIPTRMLLGRKRDGEILDSLYPERRQQWTPVSKRRQHHSIKLKRFSLIDDPFRTFEVLHEIALLEAHSAGIRVDFEDDACLDVSAYVVLGLMRQTMIRVMDGGSITGAVRAMLNAVDLASFMGVHAPAGVSDPRFSPFRLRHRRPAGSSTTTTSAFQPSRAEKLADELVDTMNSWLAVSGRPALSRDMKARVSRLVTEVLDNAVRHSDLSRKDGDWAIAGFLSEVHPKDGHGKPSLICSLAIVSLGATIFESMQQCDDPETARGLRRYVDMHAASASARHRGQALELLTTVFAMQDGVSRFRQGDDDSRGGVGLMDTIQFMNEIAVGSKEHERPALALISGRTSVFVGRDYQNAPGYLPGQPRTLWFNPGNTLEEPPDNAYVASLPYPFPGTIVTLRFCLGEGTTGPA